MHAPMNTLRKIQPMELPGVVKVAAAGARPVLKWVPPASLMVDETYQRELSRKSLQLIKQLVGNFAWNRMKPPIVVEVAGGLHVIDGQHTAIAAATVGIDKIPVFVVEAPALDERARAFVGHNSDRIAVHPIQVHRALLAAGDPDAQDVDNVCRRAGVRIRNLNQSSVIEIGDTMAIGLVQGLVRRRGVQRARKVLEALVKAKRAPLSGAEIHAADQILCVERKSLDPESLAWAIRIDGDTGLAAARATALAERSPIWRALMQRWLTRIDRRRK